MQTPFSAPSGQTITLSARHTIHSAQIDNATNQWYQILGTSTFIDPYRFNVVIPFDSAPGSVVLQPAVPPHVVQPAVIAGELVTLTLYSDTLPASTGVSQGPQGPSGTLAGSFQKVPVGDVLDHTLAGLTPSAPASIPCRAVLVRALALNGSAILIGTAAGGSGAGFRFHLQPNEAVTLPIADLNQVTIQMVAAGDGLEFIWVL